jgi:hypothetical protein
LQDASEKLMFFSLFQDNTKKKIVSSKWINTVCLKKIIRFLNDIANILVGKKKEKRKVYKILLQCMLIIEKFIRSLNDISNRIRLIKSYLVHVVDY